MTGVSSSPALATCETSHVLLAGVSGGFSWGTPVSPHLPIGSSRYESNNLERDVKLNQNKISVNSQGAHSGLSPEFVMTFVIPIYIDDFWSLLRENNTTCVPKP